MADAPTVVTDTKTAPEAIRPAEGELIEFADSLLEEAEKAKSDQAQVGQWDEWERVFWGEQWPDVIPTYKAPIVANEMQTLILAEVSDLTDSPLTVYVQKDPAKGDRDEQVEHAIQAFWKADQVDQVLMQATLDAALFPCGFVSVTWNPLAKRGLGEIDVTCRDPRSVFPDGDAVNDETWRYVILRDRVDLIEVQALWGEAGKRVQPDDRLSTRLPDTKPLKASSGRYKGPLYAPGMIVHEGYSKAQVEVKSLFIYDEETEIRLEEKRDPAGAITGLVSNRRKKYPHGRLLTWANDVVLYDGPNPYQGRFPLVRIILTPCPHAFWPGNSLVGSVVEMQKARNKLESMVVENGLRLNAGELIADADSGVDPSKEACIPGQVRLIKPGSTVKREYPNAMPPDIINSGKRLGETMREVLAMMPARMGAAARGNVSADLSETEISQSMSGSRLRGRLLHASVKKIAEMILSRMAQFYTMPRALPFVGRTGFQTVPWTPISDPSAYSVHVDEASFMVHSKTMEQRQALALAKMGKLTNRTLLKILDIPNWEKEAEELKQDLMLQAIAKGHAGRGKTAKTQL